MESTSKSQMSRKGVAGPSGAITIKSNKSHHAHANHARALDAAMHSSPGGSVPDGTRSGTTVAATPKTPSSMSWLSESMQSSPRHEVFDLGARYGGHSHSASPQPVIVSSSSMGFEWNREGKRVAPRMSCFCCNKSLTLLCSLSQG